MAMIVDDDRTVLGMVALVVTNVRLGPTNGFKLGEALRINQPGLRILFISGNVSDGTPLLMERKVPSDGYFLHKPFLPREVTEMFGLALRSGPASSMKRETANGPGRRVNPPELPPASGRLSGRSGGAKRSRTAGLLIAKDRPVSKPEPKSLHFR